MEPAKKKQRRTSRIDSAQSGQHCQGNWAEIVTVERAWREYEFGLDGGASLRSLEKVRKAGGANWRNYAGAREKWCKMVPYYDEIESRVAVGEAAAAVVAALLEIPRKGASTPDYAAYSTILRARMRARGEAAKRAGGGAAAAAPRVDAPRASAPPPPPPMNSQLCDILKKLVKINTPPPPPEAAAAADVNAATGEAAAVADLKCRLDAVTRERDHLRAALAAVKAAIAPSPGFLWSVAPSPPGV